MSGLAQGIIVVCVVLLTVVLISTLLAIKRAAVRAETVLHLAEREIRPLASQVESLADELRALSQNANQNMERVGVIVDRVEDTSYRVARFVGAMGGVTRIGQYASLAAGIRRGLSVFMSRLRHR